MRGEAQAQAPPSRTATSSEEAPTGACPHPRSPHPPPPIDRFENVLVAQDGSLRLCDFGSASAHAGVVTDRADRAEQARRGRGRDVLLLSRGRQCLLSPPSQEDAITRFTTPHFRSPEMVDIYSGLPLDCRVRAMADGEGEGRGAETGRAWDGLRQGTILPFPAPRCAGGCVGAGLPPLRPHVLPAPLHRRGCGLACSPPREIPSPLLPSHGIPPTGPLGILSAKYKIPAKPVFPAPLNTALRACLQVSNWGGEYDTRGQCGGRR